MEILPPPRSIQNDVNVHSRWSDLLQLLLPLFLFLVLDTLYYIEQLLLSTVYLHAHPSP